MWKITQQYQRGKTQVKRPNLIEPKEKTFFYRLGKLVGIIKRLFGY